MTLRTFIINTAKTLIAAIIALTLCALIICFTSCSSKRTLTDATSHVSDTTHVTIFHDSVRVTLRDTTIINFRDSTIVHTKIIERFDPSTGNLTERETDHFESLYREYLDRSSRSIDSLRHIIDSTIATRHTYDEEQHITNTRKPSGFATSIALALLTLIILICILLYRHNNPK